MNLRLFFSFLDFSSAQKFFNYNLTYNRDNNDSCISNETDTANGNDDRNSDGNVDNDESENDNYDINNNNNNNKNDDASDP